MGDVRLPGQLDQRRAEADGDCVLGRQYRARQPFRLHPALSWRVQVPGAVHAHVRVENQAGREAHQQVLAHRVDSRDGAAAEAGKFSRSGVDDRLAQQPPPQGLGRAVDGVTFRHTGPCPAASNRSRPL